MIKVNATNRLIVNADLFTKFQNNIKRERLVTLMLGIQKVKEKMCIQKHNKFIELITPTDGDKIKEINK